MKSVPTPLGEKAGGTGTDAGSGDDERRGQVVHQDEEGLLIYRAGERALDACPAGGCG